LARLAVNEWKATPEVKSEFAKELEFYPRDYLANYMTGFLASGERDYPASEKSLKIATEENPRAPEPWLYMGLNAYAQSDTKRAEECFRKAITLTGTDESRSNYQIRRAYVSLGRILANSGREEESQTYLAKARDLQNKTMELSQQNVASMATAEGAGAATGAATGAGADAAATTATGAIAPNTPSLFGTANPPAIAALASSSDTRATEPAACAPLAFTKKNGSHFAHSFTR